MMKNNHYYLWWDWKWNCIRTASIQFNTTIYAARFRLCVYAYTRTILIYIYLFLSIHLFCIFYAYLYFFSISIAYLKKRFSTIIKQLCIIYEEYKNIYNLYILRERKNSYGKNISCRKYRRKKSTRKISKKIKLYRVNIRLGVSKSKI